MYQLELEREIEKLGTNEGINIMHEKADWTYGVRCIVIFEEIYYISGRLGGNYKHIYGGEDVDYEIMAADTIKYIEENEIIDSEEFYITDAVNRW